MQLVSVEKLTGAPRGRRHYEIGGADTLKWITVKFNIVLADAKLNTGVIEINATDESQLLTDANLYREKQIKEQSKEARKRNRPKVKAATLEQGTKEWLEARVGIITASETPFRLDGTKIPTFTEYVNRKVAEAYLVKVGKKTEERYESPILSRGLEMEPLALERYKALTGNTIASRGLVVAQESPIGASPDGVAVTDDMERINIEIKSLQMPGYLSELYDGKKVKDYYAQMQTQMYILDVDMTHFIVQCQDDEDLPIILREVKRDEVFIENMIGTVKEFDAEYSKRMGILLEHIEENK